MIESDSEAAAEPAAHAPVPSAGESFGSQTVRWSEISPLLASLVCAIVVFIGFAHVDDAAQRARWLEVSGQARGPIVDEAGRPLAFTVPSSHGAARRHALPGLAPVLGYRTPASTWSGLEGTFSSFLDATGARRGWRHYAGYLLGRDAAGDTVHLTLSRRIQSVASTALGKAMGAVVALDPRTGGVLALVSNPSCSPSTLQHAPGYAACAASPAAPLVNRAVARTFAPGSDFKIVTLTAALDSGRFHLSDRFSGADVFGPSPYFDNSVYASNITRDDLHVLSLSQALAFSDNFTFAHIGLTLGSSILLRYAHRYHIGRRIPFELPVAVSSIAEGEPKPSRSVLAQSAFGAETDRVTPLQMALVAATVANHGVMVAPHLLGSITAPGGKTVRRVPPVSLGRVMKKSTAAQITTAMSFVVNHGSGFKAQIAGIQVAGKTGTAASGGAKPNAWFICFAPAAHPVVAVAVLHQFSGEGFEYAAPIARKVLIAALNERGFKLK